MPGDITPWDPNDWEQHIQLVLKLRYAQPVGSYQQIPDDIKGDCGIEGFAKDGTAYQCYACQNWTDFRVLLDHQKNKMTVDIGKLLKNEDELLTILGEIRIGIWNFVLPFWNDKELLKHARRKEMEVRGKKPKHLKADFQISVITGDEFLMEKRMLARQDLYKFDVKQLPNTVPTAAQWMQQNEGLELVTNLTRKATVIAKGKSAKMRENFLNQMVKDYTAGSIVLSRLEQELPEAYEAVIKKKTDREGELETASVTNTFVPGKFFDETLKQYKAELRGVSVISPRAVDILAREAVSDWLMRCPLEFE
ncbi:MAG: hypothetical protein LAO21_21210 [Acidobacteriia bacterium]|nr:hypothetical protein [Terriglobia bacterium]